MSNSDSEAKDVQDLFTQTYSQYTVIDAQTHTKTNILNLAYYHAVSR